MNYIVFDLEWNQNPSGKKTRNDRLPFEIIEIGHKIYLKRYRIAVINERFFSVYNSLHILLVQFTSFSFRLCQQFTEILILFFPEISVRVDRSCFPDFFSKQSNHW